MVDWTTILGDDAGVLRESNFQLLLLANTVGPLGLAVLSPVLNSLIDPFGVSEAKIGLLMSAFTAPAIVMMPVVGMLADRYGRKTILVVGLTLFGATGTAIAFTTDFRLVLGLRFLQGVGFAGTTPIIIATIGDFYKETKETTAQGLRFSGSGVVQTVFPVISGSLVVIAWQFPFLLYGLAFPVAATLYIWFEDPNSSDDQVPDSKKSNHDNSLSISFREFVTEPRIWIMVLARGFPPIAWIGFLTYNSILVVRVMGGSPPQAGMLAAIGSLAYAATATQAGRITAYFDSWLLPLEIANLGLSGGIAVVILAPNVIVGGFGIALAGSSFGIILSLYRSIITGLAPPAFRGGLVSVSEAAGRLSATLIPILMGEIISFTTPLIGALSAIRIAGLSAGVLGGVGSAICLLVMQSFSPVEYPAKER